MRFALPVFRLSPTQREAVPNDLLSCKASPRWMSPEKRIMNVRTRTITSIAAISAAALGFIALTAARRSPVVERIDFDHTMRADRARIRRPSQPGVRRRHQGLSHPDQGRARRDREGRDVRGLDLRRHRARPGAPRSAGRSRSHQRGQRVADAALDRLSRRAHSGERRLSDDHAARFGRVRVRRRAIPARSWCTAARRR